MAVSHAAPHSTSTVGCPPLMSSSPRRPELITAAEPHDLVSPRYRAGVAPSSTASGPSPSRMCWFLLVSPCSRFAATSSARVSPSQGARRGHPSSETLHSLHNSEPGPARASQDPVAVRRPKYSERRLTGIAFKTRASVAKENRASRRSANLPLPGRSPCAPALSRSDARSPCDVVGRLLPHDVVLRAAVEVVAAALQ